MRSGISVVINTLNEERNLPYALRSVRSWAEEIVVVDMYSDDRTVEIAREFGARVHFHERVLAFDQARVFAVNQASCEWVLLLDADELVPQPLSERLLQIASGNAAEVVIISWVNYLLGGPLPHTGWGPTQDRHPRFFRRGKVELGARVHDFIHAAPGARVLRLPSEPALCVHHFNYIDCKQFLEKLNRYTTIEAQQTLDGGEHPGRLKAITHAMLEFARRYLWRGGYRDGWRGFYLSLLMAHYRVATYAKMTELKETGGPDAIDAAYRQEAERLLSSYEHRP